MSNLVVFPWTDREEVRAVYEELFSQDVRKQKHAIGRMSVWKSRSMKRMPAAVESTFSIINAQIASTEMDIRSLGVDVHLRNLYSMAVLRFVNHITEKGQQGTFAKPIHLIASTLGVPEWIVELRHEATHGSLPSLNELTAACSWALDWLRENFWEPQTSETFGISSLRTAAGDIFKDSLVTYMQSKFGEINRGEASSNKQLMINIEHMLQQLGSGACPILCENGYLVPTEEQLDSLGYSYADLRSSGSLLLPRKVIDFWKKVIVSVVKRNLIAQLLLHMASILTEESSVRNFFLFCWLYTLIWHNKTDKVKKSKFNLFQGPVDMPYICLIEKCLQIRNRDAESLANLMIENANLDMGQKQYLKQFLSVCKKALESHGHNSVRKVMCIDDLHDTVHKERKFWRKCLEPVDWSNIPIGLLPNQTFDYTCLELCSSLNDISGDRSSISRERDEDNDNQSMSDILNALDSENEISNCELEPLNSPTQYQWNEKMKLTIADNMQLF